MRTLCCRAVPDSQTLGVLLAAQLAPRPGLAAQQHALRAYVDMPQASLAVLLQKPGCPAHQPEYHPLDKSSTLAAQLAGKRIVEWPILLAVLLADLASYTVVADHQPCLQSAAAAQQQ